MVEFNSPEPIDEQTEELLAGYILGAIAPEDAKNFAQQLQANPDLDREAVRCQEVMALMAYAPPQKSAPQHLRDRLLAAAQPPLAVVAQPKRRLVFSRSKIAAAVAAVLAAILAVDNYLLRQELAGSRAKIETLQGSQTYLVALKKTPTTPVLGSVLIDLASGRAVMSLQNLPPLSGKQFYYLWVITGERKIPVGRLNVDSSNRVDVAIPAGEYKVPGTTLLITIESSDKPIKPSEAVIMTSTAWQKGSTLDMLIHRQTNIPKS